MGVAMWLIRRLHRPKDTSTYHNVVRRIYALDHWLWIAPHTFHEEVMFGEIRYKRFVDGLEYTMKRDLIKCQGIGSCEGDNCPTE